MKAKLIFHRKNVEPNGDIIEMKMWNVPGCKDRPRGSSIPWSILREGKESLGTIMARERDIIDITGIRKTSILSEGWMSCSRIFIEMLRRSDGARYESYENRYWHKKVGG